MLKNFKRINYTIPFTVKKFADQLIAEKDNTYIAIAVSIKLYSYLISTLSSYEDNFNGWRESDNLIPLLFGIPIIPLNEGIDIIGLLYPCEETILNRDICKNCVRLQNEIYRELICKGIFPCEGKSNIDKPPIECPYYLEHIVGIENNVV